MEAIITSLGKELPSAVAIIAVVVIFARSQEKRDVLYTEAMAKITERLNAMENLLIAHDVKTDAAVAAMRRKKMRTAKNAV